MLIGAVVILKARSTEGTAMIPIVIVPWRVVKWFLILAIIAPVVVIGGLYVTAVFFEPAQRETGTPMPGVKVRR